MKTPRIYVETSVFNFYFSEQSEEKRLDTLKLFAEIEAGKYEPYTSDYVLQELKRADARKQALMIGLIEKYHINFLPINAEAEKLANIYVAQNIIPQKHLTDAQHIAMTTVSDLDFIVSYNFQHIVKRKTLLMTKAVNLQEGYREIGIFSPTEVIENEE
ncbi:MAG: hypothetical protein LBQ83_00165 [Candidatus Margulisbacteria bacterium]|jgi:predicted nucleic acid-binding protein|nr:hypothetical protein [Candidatus Margulisiibacteriota bacterium]